MERQYIIFFIAAAAGFGALIIVGLYYYPQVSQGNNGIEIDDDPNVIKARVGDRVHIVYPSGVVSVIQNLPAKNILDLVLSSELAHAEIEGRRGEVKYSGWEISYMQNGRLQNETDDTFQSIEYRFFPDSGNTTTYSFKNVNFESTSGDPQLVATVVPLNSAQPGQYYTVKMVLDAGIIDYALGERKIQILP